jgi:hypothetical protein
VNIVKLQYLGLVGVACVALGCGGGGGHGDRNNPNPFWGSWFGTINADSSPTENMRLTIAVNGSITGSETVGSQTAADTGDVDRNGNFNITSRLAGTPDVRYRGQMNYDFNNHIIGTGTGTQNGNTVNIQFDLRPN